MCGLSCSSSTEVLVLPGAANDYRIGAETPPPASLQGPVPQYERPQLLAAIASERHQLQTLISSHRPAMQRTLVSEPRWRASPEDARFSAAFRAAQAQLEMALRLEDVVQDPSTGSQVTAFSLRSDFHLMRVVQSLRTATSSLSSSYEAAHQTHATEAKRREVPLSDSDSRV